MATNIINIKDGKIVLPGKLRNAWRSGKAIAMGDESGFFIQSLADQNLADLKPALKKLGKKVKDKDIVRVVRWARRKTYARRA